MPEERENKCCHDYTQFKARLKNRDGSSCKCITETQGFQSVCLDLDVAEMDYYDFRQDYGHHGDDEAAHDLFRHLAYKRLIKWTFKKLGKHNRKIIPSCAVLAIRAQYPDENDQYTGFKYPLI